MILRKCPNRKREQKHQDENEQIQKKERELAEDNNSLQNTGLQMMAPHAVTGNPLPFDAPPALLGFGRFKASNSGT
jgi:hypothetical protein